MNLGRIAYLEETLWTKCTGGMHRFFYFCVEGDQDKVDTSYLDWTDIMREVERRKIHCKPPAWITTLTKGKERRPGAEKKRRVPDPEDGRNRRIFNPEISEECRLTEDESYKFMFNPNSVKDIQKPKKRGGEVICLRYHTLGHSFKDCRFKNGHGTLEREEKEKLMEYLKEVRAFKKKFGNRGRRQPQRTRFDGDIKGKEEKVEGEKKQG